MIHPHALKPKDIRDIPHLEEESYLRMVEAVQDYAIFLIDPKGYVLSWNAGAEKVEGYSESEILGEHFSRFYPLEDVRSGKPQKLLALATRKGHTENEGWRIRKDSSRFWVQDTLTPLYDSRGGLLGYTEIMRDMTEKKKAVEDLRKNEEKFRLMVEAVQDYAIFMLDPFGNITSWNAGAEKMKGYQPGEIMGKNIAVFYSEEDRRAQKPAQALREALEKGRSEDKGWRIRKDGSRFWGIEVITSLKDRSGKHIGFSKVTRDITDRKQAAESLEEYASKLVEFNIELETFAYIAAHDLKEPIRMVSTFADLLAIHCAGKLDDEARKFLGYLTDGASRAQQLVDDLLQYATLESHGQAFSEKLDPAEIIRQAIADLRPLIDETSAVITHDEPLPKISGDKRQLGQLFKGLIENGVKFHGDRQPRVHVGVRGNADEWVFSVHDNGLGIDPRYTESIFVIFKRLHARSEYPGTGIGLSICKKIVERHQGRIWLESQPGKGSTFYVALPKAPSGRPDDTHPVSRKN